LLLTGKLTTDFQWGGYAGVRGLLQADSAPKNMSQFAGVQFYTRGDGKTYRVLVARDSVKDFNHFYAEFKPSSEWTLVQVPFSKLIQSPHFGTQVKWSPEDVTAVGFVAQADPGSAAEVKLEVDDIAFYSQKGPAPSAK
jgi:hypothetical protein